MPPETRKAPGQGSPVLRRLPINTTSDHATEPATLQEKRIARLFAVSLATAATIAKLVYGAVRP